ncbi:MAG: universal stress protein [Planctomycetes bacterium]|nr:universal stress protein [Planctomycetota bacterium]
MSWFPKRSIVVPVDFSDDSFAAVDTALELIDDPSGLHVVHVLPEPHAVEPGVEWQMIDNENRRRHAFEALRSALSDAKYEKVQVEIEFGSPGYRIAEHAEKLDAELIVIPSHGRTGLKRMMLGSVAERVIRLSHCPVLVLRK